MFKHHHMNNIYVCSISKTTKNESTNLRIGKKLKRRHLQPKWIVSQRLHVQRYVVFLFFCQTFGRLNFSWIKTMKRHNASFIVSLSSVVAVVGITSAAVTGFFHFQSCIVCAFNTIRNRNTIRNVYKIGTRK